MSEELSLHMFLALKMQVQCSCVFLLLLLKKKEVGQLEGKQFLDVVLLSFPERILFQASAFSKGGIL